MAPLSIGIGLELDSRMGLVGPDPLDAIDNYYQPDGASAYLRPDGSSFYVRP